ncbi:ImmA/IrrE family metallo-endopeptidase [Effusibacillus pohliae]|uniref:ImmA/IrrE family metallo-endopeptidase n=1 Tax=Effusibacillus pohliae TaxID=232270 RepID=UPI000382208C|nr:ImmA/IrrE family metallo-endopeptidase [Effusibacillus pohliae]
MKLADLLPARRTPSITEQIANGVIERFGYQRPDEIDIEEICDHYKIKIKPSPEPDVTYSVCTGFRKGFIYLQETDDWIQRKELLGEEFAHLYLHTISQMQSTREVTAKQERQAKDFSAYLFMPWKMLQDIVIAYDQPVDIAMLADEFLVSEEFVYYRLSLILPEKADALARTKAGFGYIRWIE